MDYKKIIKITAAKSAILNVLRIIPDSINSEWRCAA